MYKELHLLGLLLAGPRTGYQLHRIVVAHGEFYTDLKRGNVYYLLDRLRDAGALTVTAEGGARGPRRERLVYAITDQGRQRFFELLRAVVRTYEPAYTGVEVGMIFLPHLAPDEAIHLLEERRQAVLAQRAVIENKLGAAGHLPALLAQDHLMSLMDAEAAWIERSLQRLRRHLEDEGAPASGATAPDVGVPANDPA